MDLVQITKRPALIVLNAAPPRGGLAAQAAEAIRAYGVPVAEARISQRAALVYSLTAGQTVFEYESARSQGSQPEFGPSTLSRRNPRPRDTQDSPGPPPRAHPAWKGKKRLLPGMIPAF